MAKKNAPLGSAVGGDGDQIFFGSETGIFPARVTALIETTGSETAGRLNDALLEKINCLFAEAIGVDSSRLSLVRNDDFERRFQVELREVRKDAEIVLEEVLGSDWREFIAQLDIAYLSSGVRHTLRDGSLADIAPINFEVRTSLQQWQIEQLIDARDLWDRIKSESGSDEPAPIPKSRQEFFQQMLECMAISKLWIRMLVRTKEECANRGEVVREGAVRGGESQRKLSASQTAELRAVILEASTKRTALINSLATKFGVSKRTIQRRIKEERLRLNELLGK